MKKEFPEHFRPNENLTKKIWKHAIFVFDANILCNVYRYPDDAREKFIEVLKSYHDRLWLPHNAVREFLNNRLDVIGDQVGAYQKTLEQISNLESTLTNNRQHPFLTEDSLGRLKDTFEKIKSELKDNEKVHLERISDDSILTRLAQVFEGKVGTEFEEKELREIFEEGRSRYSESIPPGFKDAKKASEDETSKSACQRRYGDLIIWKEIIYKAKNEDVDIIFVTDDKKEDWWLIEKGKSLSPRPELIREFMLETGNQFLMYTMDRFLTNAAKDLKIRVEDSVVDDVRRVGNLDTQNSSFDFIDKVSEIIRSYKQSQYGSSYRNMMEKKENLKNQLAHTLKKLEILKYKWSIEMESEEKSQLAHEKAMLESDVKTIAFEIEELENHLWSKQNSSNINDEENVDEYLENFKNKITGWSPSR